MYQEQAIQVEQPSLPTRKRKGNTRSRRFGPSVITAQHETNNPSYVKRSKMA